MPYIDHQIREQLRSRAARTPGELTYVLTVLCKEYLSITGPCFSDMAEVLGSLEATKLELYRTVIGPYEEKKRKMNGDVE